MAQPAASNTIQEVTEAIISVSARRKLVDFSLTPAAKDEAKAAFARRGAIPGVLACVDGTLIAVMKPEGLSPADTASFMSRKGYYALNVIVVCNSELCILVVDLRLPDSGHDSWMWQHNPLCTRLAAQLQPGESLLGGQLRLVPGSAPSPVCPPEPLPSSLPRCGSIAAGLVDLLLPPLVDRFHNGPFRVQHVGQLLPQLSSVDKAEARPSSLDLKASWRCGSIKASTVSRWPSETRGPITGAEADTFSYMAFRT
ncbi:uncharacterized protein LOC119444643 [Dermacentor silvarum]|uniref:uncharacterized protein LOC119444643 n=1 Tax=Dermacentor silvarum TaxID=543639 RepID=UPI00189C066A|nr:uncharacterized protein LOC119444643 [Dermacentor silvarum]